MRLFIIFIFLTFVLLQKNNAAPQSNPIQSSPIADKSLLKGSSDDYTPSLENRQYKLHLGVIGGDFGDSTAGDLNYFVSALKKKELSFEHYFYWGFGLTSNQMLELKAQMALSNVFVLNPSWDFLGLGFSQFLIGRDGISNLVNINQSKLVFYSDLGSYSQLQIYYGLKGLAYSLSFQMGF